MGEGHAPAKKGKEKEREENSFGERHSVHSVRKGSSSSMIVLLVASSKSSFGRITTERTNSRTRDSAIYLIENVMTASLPFHSPFIPLSFSLVVHRRKHGRVFFINTGMQVRNARRGNPRLAEKTQFAIINREKCECRERVSRIRVPRAIIQRKRLNVRERNRQLLICRLAAYTRKAIFSRVSNMIFREIRGTRTLT